MKKSLSTTLSIVFILVFALFGIASSSSEDSGEAQNNNGEEQVQTNPTSDDTLGDYVVKIKSARMTKTYDGKAAIVITYAFTNNNSEPQAFSYAIEDAVFQNGIGLNEAYFLTDNDNYSSDNQIKEIKQGSTLNVDVAYELNDSTSDIEVELSEYFSLTDEKITKTFSLK